MCEGLEEILTLQDPIGKNLESWTRPNGLKIEKISVPLGVIGIIYESRPNVTVDAGSLCIKSGNVCILRGGSDSFYSSKLLASLMQEALHQSGLPKNVVQFVETTDRSMVTQMLQASKYLDVIIPRGGKSLVEKIQQEARVPVFAHLEGICHVYIDHEANMEIALNILLNSKLRRTGICGAAETLLIDKRLDENHVSDLIYKLISEGCEVRAEKAIQNKFNKVLLATEKDWRTEYLDSIISVKYVNDVEHAIEHINEYSSDHTETIVTENKRTAEKFLSHVDSAIVMHNASTQFADGGEFGMGAEIGISTGRLHARGPVGTEQLTSFKYIVRGTGQIRKI
tara:strand:+ start:6 stop:1025 length:1020 start_codon:yes stop_codon:yes gene_type:complete